MNDLYKIFTPILLYHLFSFHLHARAFPTIETTNGSIYSITPPQNSSFETTTNANSTTETITESSVLNYDDSYNDYDCLRCDVSNCHNNGDCCLSGDVKFCLCAHGYWGEHCESYDPEESKYDKMKLTLVASLATLFIILLALLLLIFVVCYALRKGKKHHASSLAQYGVLDKELLYVQGELLKLTGKDRTCAKMRLSTMIEATARAALITYPDLVSFHDDSNIRTPIPANASKITRRQSDPCIIFHSKEDLYRVERSTAVLYYNKPGKVQMAKRNLRKLLSH